MTLSKSTKTRNITSENTHGFQIQDSPPVFCGGIRGDWLLKHVTPSWRAKDPEEGWQRIVSQARTEEIARRILDNNRTFPNAVILGTDRSDISVKNGQLLLPDDVKLLVIDGQHRIYAQKKSKNIAIYSCIIHAHIAEVDMAKLFLEINDNQKRVPASLRWDLVRLLKPEEDPFGVRAADIIFELATDKRSPLRQRIDLTGESSRITLKQASLAPEIKNLVSRKTSPLYDLGDKQVEILINYFTAIREIDVDGWNNETGPLYAARIIRALLQVLPDIMNRRNFSDPSAHNFFSVLQKINLSALNSEDVTGQQGNAGVKAFRDTILEFINK